MSKIKLFNGLSIAFQRFGCNNSQGNVLCLHGWLDNSNSFKFLGPHLANKGFDVVAIDFTNHGLSDHRSDDVPILNFLRVQDVKGVIDALGWDKNISLVGHSMGAAISTIFSGCFPKLVNKMVLIDGLSPFIRNDDQSCLTLRKALESEEKYFSKMKAMKTPKLYPTLETAIQARLLSVASLPGEQKLSYEAASAIVRRGVVIHGRPDLDPNLVSPDTGPVTFIHNSREMLPSYSYLTQAQVISYIKEIQSKTFCIQAENGWPSANEALEQERVSYFRPETEFRHILLPGGHHLHLDPESRDRVALEVSDFLISK